MGNIDAEMWSRSAADKGRTYNGLFDLFAPYCIRCAMNKDKFAKDYESGVGGCDKQPQCQEDVMRFDAPTNFRERPDMEIEDGMNLRDWFAGQALSGLIDPSLPPAAVASQAYLIADAMIKARNAPK